MLYKRSSFIAWLREVHACDIIPLPSDRNHSATIMVKYGPCKTYIYSDGKDRIDYEEIQLHCQKLWLTRWPNDNELIRIN